MHELKSLQRFIEGLVSVNILIKINSSIPPGQNGRHFADDDFICISVNEKFCTLINIPLKFVPKGPIGNNPAFV